MWHFKNSKFPIGLDISDLSLKFVQLNKNGDKINIQAFSKYNLTPGIIDNGDIKNPQEVIKAINYLMANPIFGKVTAKEIVACLPNSKTYIKSIAIDKTPNDLENIIEEEIEKHIPVSINNIYYDWQTTNNIKNKLRVLIGAGNKNIVEQYTNLFNEAKLSLVALELEPVCLCRALLREEHYKFTDKFDKNYCLIDFGATRTNMTVYSKNTILFTISMPISGEKITENIATTLKIEKKQAEKAKLICGFDSNSAEGIIKNILTDVVNKLILKIHQTIAFYQAEYSDNGPINKIILCGGGAYIKEFDEIIAESTSIETVRGDSFINFNIPSQKESSSNKIFSNGLSKLLNENLSYTTAIGLALREIFINDI